MGGSQLNLSVANDVLRYDSASGQQVCRVLNSLQRENGKQQELLTNASATGYWRRDASS